MPTKTSVKGADLIATLKTIKRGEHYDIWNLLPDIASGKEWIAEINDAVDALVDFITESEEYDLDELRDNNHEYADNCASSSYKYIHDKNHALSLWASEEIEAEAEELMDNNPQTIKRLESLYYYVATRMVWDAVADQAYENTEEGEE